MKVVVDMYHPADVHFFKNFIRELEKKGHEILITAGEKDVSCVLLNNYGFDYINVGSYGSSVIKKLINIPLIDLKMYKEVKSFNPDIFVGFGSSRAAHVAFLLRKKCINFEDTEHEMEQIMLYLPFVSTVCTPLCFKKDLGKKQLLFDGYKELAYLHPNYFKPDPAVLKEIGLSEKNKFIILRFVSWNATHDIGHHGITNKKHFIEELETYGDVFITSEVKLDNSLKKYELRVSPEKLHDLLYYANLYIGEGATIASESAVLGTPSIYISSLAGAMGYLTELEQKYNLMFSCDHSGKAISNAIELIQKPNLKEEWRKRRERLLRDKINVTAFMVWFVENYPQSLEEMKENPEIQNEFK